MKTEKRLIDANALMEHLTKCIEQSKGLMRSVCVAIKCFVEQMSTVEAVEVVHGRWLPSDDPVLYNIYGVAVCSVCGYSYAGNNSNYCPDCGAKMDGERKIDGM